MSLSKILALVALLLAVLAFSGVVTPLLVPASIGCLAAAILVGS